MSSSASHQSETQQETGQKHKPFYRHVLDDFLFVTLSQPVVPYCVIRLLTLNPADSVNKSDTYPRFSPVRLQKSRGIFPLPLAHRRAGAMLF